MINRLPWLQLVQEPKALLSEGQGPLGSATLLYRLGGVTALQSPAQAFLHQSLLPGGKLAPEQHLSVLPCNGCHSPTLNDQGDLPKYAVRPTRGRARCCKSRSIGVPARHT